MAVFYWPYKYEVGFFMVVLESQQTPRPPVSPGFQGSRTTPPPPIVSSPGTQSVVVCRRACVPRPPEDYLCWLVWTDHDIFWNVDFFFSGSFFYPTAVFRFTPTTRHARRSKGRRGEREKSRWMWGTLIRAQQTRERPCQHACALQIPAHAMRCA